ncbi:MAG TPA: alkaline phosphatase family protein [Gemmatimonadales bacterium]|nr:alkaline phosphatase family protein [Gemmatimonadales bacterium]
MGAARVTIIGLDAASPILLRRWMADGSLPNLAALAARGRTGAVRSVEGFFVGATWPSFQTGRSPAGHGLHYLAQIRPGTYDYYQPFDEAETGPGEPFWRPLSQEGHRVAVLDVPLSRLEPAINGMQTVEWGGHDSIFGFQANPAEVVPELLERFGPHPVGPVCDGRRTTLREWQAFRDALVHGAATKAELTRACLERGPWDLLLQVFTEAHCAGHQMWHLHDPAHPAHDADLCAQLGDPLQQVYQAVDTAVGRVLDDAGDGTVLVTSLHGMGGYFGAGFLLHDVLVRLGAATQPPTPPRPRTPGNILVDSARTLWKQLPDSVRDRLRPLRQRVLPDPPAGPRTIGVDPQRSRCFVVGNGAPVSGIRLNLVGREPQGCLVQGAEADQFVADLTGDLLGVMDERTGRPAITAVTRTAALHAGPQLHRLPDLLVEWADQVQTGSMQLAGGRGATVRLTSPAIGTVEGVNWYGRSGDHRAGGLYILAGADIPPRGEGGALGVADLTEAITKTVRHGAPCEAFPIA